MNMISTKIGMDAKTYRDSFGFAATSIIILPMHITGAFTTTLINIVEKF